TFFIVCVYLLFLRAFFPLFHSKSASSELIFSWMHLGGFVLRYLIDIGRLSPFMRRPAQGHKIEKSTVPVLFSSFPAGGVFLSNP
ncbi:MAG: hypothetical protein J6N32_09710, partial [Clostridia bacterium]|nr:hypothetical protein [Clostridia bacterium]